MNNIAVLAYSNRLDLQKKKLMMFLEALQAEYKATGKGNIDVLGLTIELKTIRKYVAVQAGNPSLVFLLGQVNLQQGETFLDNSDAFMPCEMAFGFAKVPNGEVIANQEIYNYPDKTVFNDATVVAAPIEWKGLLSYYWGAWELSINDKTVTSQIHAQRLLKVAQVQETAAGLMAYHQEGRFAELYNTPILDGNKSIKLKFTPVPNVNTSNAAGDPTAEVNYAVMELQGFVVKDLSSALNALNKMYYGI
jgi:hypothetical protein